MSNVSSMPQEDGATAHHRQRYAKYYKTGVLSPNYHWPLVDELERFTTTANIPATFVWKYRMSHYCSKAEIEWVRSYRRKKAGGIAGLMYTGSPKNMDNRMMAVTGAMLRNYIDARFMTMHDIIDHLKGPGMVRASMILVPNFVTFGKEGSMLDWQVHMVHDWLLNRCARNDMTVLYVASQQKVRSQWGAAIVDHITSHYDGVEIT